jgi:cobyric acid synthase
MPANVEVSGYEIHMGVMDPNDGSVTPQNQAVVGTMIHGLFESAIVRSHLLSSLRARKGLPASPSKVPALDEYDRLADTLKQNLDLGLLFNIARHAQRVSQCA